MLLLLLACGGSISNEDTSKVAPPILIVELSEQTVLVGPDTGDTTVTVGWNASYRSDDTDTYSARATEMRLADADGNDLVLLPIADDIDHMLPATVHYLLHDDAPGLDICGETVQLELEVVTNDATVNAPGGTAVASCG